VSDIHETVIAEGPPEGPDAELDVPIELKSLTNSLVSGGYDLEAAALDGAVTLSFTTLESMERFIGICLHSEPEELSRRIAGREPAGCDVEGGWKYHIEPETIVLIGDEAGISWRISVEFPRSDLAEVERRVLERLPYVLIADNAYDGIQEGSSLRWYADTKEQALCEAAAELEKGEFRRVRISRYDRASGLLDEDVLTAD
jgi:hypothetical protein